MSVLPGLSLTSPQTGLTQQSHQQNTYSVNANASNSTPINAANLLSILSDSPPRTHDLESGSEYRFEVSYSQPPIRIKLISGTAELFGTELPLNVQHTFPSGTKAAIYTWHGCRIEVVGSCESEYVAEETPMAAYANVHFGLERERERTASTNVAGVSRDNGGSRYGPRVLIIGPPNAGKTSLARLLTAYATRSGRQPAVVNLDPRQGFLSVPGSLSAAVFASPIDVEDGWGSSPVSGPTALPVKTPLVYHYGLPTPADGPKLYRPLVTRLALAVTSRMEEDEAVRGAGCIIDTPGSISLGKEGAYDDIKHIIAEFSVTVLLVLGSERLFSDMTRRFANTQTTNTISSSGSGINNNNNNSNNDNASEPISVIKLAKSGGCVDRDETYMRQLRHAQIRTYFFGDGSGSAAGGGAGGTGAVGMNGTLLNPHTQVLDYQVLKIFRVASASTATSSHHLTSFLPGNDDDDDDDDHYDDHNAITNANNKNNDNDDYEPYSPTALTSAMTTSSSAPRAKKSSSSSSSSSTSTLYDLVPPSPMLQNSLLAITHATAPDTFFLSSSLTASRGGGGGGAAAAAAAAQLARAYESIRDASVMGYVYVVDVDDGKKKVRLLTPVSERLPVGGGGGSKGKALVMGSGGAEGEGWPEDVVGLVG